jgi:glyoxylase-like metal-dependent hydrolase (beta-lactamase superfamily II)/rhodanese-related sulfurtransferase|nr:MAG: MBL fold metallo-hydrolase [Bacteroidota bacterium]
MEWKTQFTPEEVAELLERGVGFGVLDVRNEEEFRRWRLEGPNTPQTLHIPYFEALEDEEAFVSRVEAELGRGPILAICAKGGSSDWIAQEILRPRGFQVANMIGGMEAWGSSYRIRLLPESKQDTVRIWQLDRFGRGCLHYVVASEGEAILIDPPRHIERVLELLSREGLQIRAILDTHAHADHISGGPALAERTGAPYYLHPYDGIHPIDVLPAQIPFAFLQEGMRFSVGSAALDVLHIPGHTLGNTAFLLQGQKRYLFTGDSLFIQSVARPDLGGRGEAWAPLHFRSLRRLLHLPADTIVLPGHYASAAREQRADGLFAAPLGELLRSNPDLALQEEEAFVSYILAHLPEFPPQYVDIKRVNAGLLRLDEEGLNELELGKNVCALSGAYTTS